MEEQPFMVSVLVAIVVVCLAAFAFNFYFNRKLNRKLAEKQRREVQSARFVDRFGVRPEDIQDETQRALIVKRVRKALDELDKARLKAADAVRAFVAANLESEATADTVLKQLGILRRDEEWRRNSFDSACALAREFKVLEGQEAEEAPAA